jgi:hypothetical protein
MKRIQTFTSITFTFHNMHNTKGMSMKIIMQNCFCSQICIRNASKKESNFLISNHSKFQFAILGLAQTMHNKQTNKLLDIN